MKFVRPDLDESVMSLIRSTDASERCIGANYRMEENVSVQRQQAFEVFNSSTDDIRVHAERYYEDSIKGPSRGHRCSTFNPALNAEALLSVGIEPNQKIVRLERIDYLMAEEQLAFPELKEACDEQDSHQLSVLTDLFTQNHPGASPSFAAFRSELGTDLSEPDWLQRVIDRLGLLHHYPCLSRDAFSFALMEYTAKEVIDQARAQSIDRCFAIASVLESRNNPAFFPVPRGSRHGYTVNLDEKEADVGGVREILHVRFDYSWWHVKRLEQWKGAETPDIAAVRARHLQWLRVETGRPDFGDMNL